MIVKRSTEKRHAARLIPNELSEEELRWYRSRSESHRGSVASLRGDTLWTAPQGGC